MLPVSKLPRLNRDGDALTGEPEHFDCDLLLMSGGLNPVVHLHSQGQR